MVCAVSRVLYTSCQKVAAGTNFLLRQLLFDREIVFGGICTFFMFLGTHC
jgi:hypothetical protein